MMLIEKYRPKIWSEVVGQDDAIRVIQQIRKQCGISGAWWVTSYGGQGKTSIARLLAYEVGSDLSITEHDAQDVTLDLIREFERECGFRRLDHSVRVLIVNEAHTLRGAIVNRLKTTMEIPEVVRNGLLIFTTTVHEQQQRELFSDDEAAGNPFFSRMHCLRLAPTQSLVVPFAIRCREIAQAEGLDGRMMTDYVALAKECRCNMRQMLQRVEEGRML